MALRHPSTSSGSRRDMAPGLLPNSFYQNMSCRDLNLDYFCRNLHGKSLVRPSAPAVVCSCSMLAYDAQPFRKHTSSLGATMESSFCKFVYNFNMKNKPNLIAGAQQDQSYEKFQAIFSWQ